MSMGGFGVVVVVVVGGLAERKGFLPVRDGSALALLLLPGKISRCAVGWLPLLIDKQLPPKSTARIHFYFVSVVPHPTNHSFLACLPEARNRKRNHL